MIRCAYFDAKLEVVGGTELLVGRDVGDFTELVANGVHDGRAEDAIRQNQSLLNPGHKYTY